MSENKILLKKQNRDAAALEKYKIIAPLLEDGMDSYAADRQLFAVVTADAGCGKSTLIRKFAASLPKEKYIFLYLSDSKLTPRWFYKGLLDQLGLESKFYREDAKRQLQKEIEIIRGVHGQKVVCVLDEAHPVSYTHLDVYKRQLLHDLI